MIFGGKTGGESGILSTKTLRNDLPKLYENCIPRELR